MTTTDAALLQHAAMLDVYAVSLRECHNVDPLNPTWEDEEDAQEEHDRLQVAAGELRLRATDIEALQRQLAVETDRATYGWRNVDILEKSRQEEMTKRVALQAEADALKATVIKLLEILRQWEPDHASGKDRRTIVLAMYQVGILADPTAIALPAAQTPENSKPARIYTDGMPD